MNWPRHGSLQFWPRVRAKRQHPRIRNWARLDNNTTTKILGFIGYKAGMTHVMLRDNRPTSLTKGEAIAVPATVIECPNIKVASVRLYKKTTDGLKIVSEIFNPNLKKSSSNATTSSPPKSSPKTSASSPNNAFDFDDVKVVVYTQPKIAKLKKNPQILEIAISAQSKEDKLSYAKTLLEREIKISEIFREGQYIDVHAVTKGKGFQGTVKRFGVKIRQHKSEKTKRGIGTLGAWRPRHVLTTVPQPGKMGYHTRTEYNKWVMKIASSIAEINPKGGFPHYGLISNEYILLKGSVPGPVKRAIVLTESRRPSKPETAEIKSISLASKQ